MPVKAKLILTMHGFASDFASDFVSVFVPAEAVPGAVTASGAEGVRAAEAALAALIVRAAANAA